MTINSIPFLVTIFITLCAYFALQKTDLQKYLIVVANLFFMYSFSGLDGVVIALFLVAVIYFCATKIQGLLDKEKEQKALEKQLKKAEEKSVDDGLVFKEGVPKKADENGHSKSVNFQKLIKCYLWLGILVEVGTLCYFKFFTSTWQIIKENFSIGHDLLAPAGLAYFSLSLVSYLLDVSKKKYPAEKNFLDLMCFSLFFPALIEGPFGFYKKLSPQLKERHTYDWDRMITGLQRLLWGYFKKLVIADRIGIIVMGILKDDESVGLLLFYAFVLYSFQIYADFSGGIDVVMGVAEIMGIELHENFRSPLVSKSVTEYWARWHMSLGEWMEKVIYYPLVLNKKVMKFSKKIKNKYLSRAFSATIASIVVFVIVGIWHGTGWNYVVYGCYQAFFVAGAVLLKPTYEKIHSWMKVRDEDWGFEVFQILRTFVILVFGRYLIKCANLGQTVEMLQRTFAKLNPDPFFNGGLLEYGLDFRNMTLMYMGIVLLIVVDIMHERGFHFRESLMKCNIVFRYVVYMTMIFTIIICGIYGKGYEAASFIYAGF